jgi:arginine-tRNA-protein transferase
MERKVFTHLIGSEAVNLHDTLSQGGFRRSQNIAYRPACENCTACVSVRVPVATFRPTDSMRRITRRNADLVVAEVPAQATGEHYSLFRDYILARHGDGGMSDMTVMDFTAMVDESFVDTSMIEYRLPAPVSLAGNRRRGGALVAASLTDRLRDGLSMIYSFFDPAFTSRSLGTYMILDHIARASTCGLTYLYLGYWVRGSVKMDYKARFLPQERLMRDGWTLFES